MKQSMKKNKMGILKVVVAVFAALILGASCFFAGATLMPKEVTKMVPYTVTETITEYVDVPVEVETIVEKEVYVAVDNENLDVVLEYVYSDSNLEFITEGLFDDELDVIVERILLIEEVKALSADFASSAFAYEIEKQHLYDRRDVSRVKIIEDSIYFNKSVADFKYGDFETLMTVEFRYDGVVEERDVVVEFYNDRVRSLLIE